MKDVFEMLDNVFGQHDAAWAVVGGVAANIHRDEVRTTMDLDILVSLAKRPSPTWIRPIWTSG